jgi:dual specificity tyrosine-phosphorylation-regulated kinase 2/3/4
MTCFFQSPAAAHHHKEVLPTKYGSKPQTTASGKHLKPSSKNGHSTSKTTLIPSELPLLESSKSSSRLNLNQSKTNLTPSSPMVDSFPAINNNSRGVENQGTTNNNRENNGFPMTPTDALKLYGNRLTEFEKNEIEKYSKIWYLGLNACKIHGEPGGSQNCGYDDESGSYIKVRH